MGDNKVNYDIFIEMLRELNQFIVESYNPEYILTVRAIAKKSTSDTMIY